jgi:hypothetical protein
MHYSTTDPGLRPREGVADHPTAGPVAEVGLTAWRETSKGESSNNTKTKTTTPQHRRTRTHDHRLRPTPRTSCLADRTTIASQDPRRKHICTTTSETSAATLQPTAAPLLTTAPRHSTLHHTTTEHSYCLTTLRTKQTTETRGGREPTPTRHRRRLPAARPRSKDRRASTH